MRILLTIIFIAIITFITQPVFAQEEATVTPTPTSEKKSKIEEIKEKVASTVAQLNLVSKRGILGEITKIEKNQLTIERNDEARIVDVDELTNYSRVESDDKRTELKFSDLDVGDTIVAIGIYNRESRRLLARFILVKEIAIQVSGLVKEVDIKDASITIEDKKKGESFIIDIDKKTIIRNYTKAKELVKSTLPKIEIGQRAHVFGLANKGDKNHVSASRLLLLPGKVTPTSPSPTQAAKDEGSPSGSPIPTKIP